MTSFMPTILKPESCSHRCSPPACRKGSRPEQLSGFNIVGMKLVIQRCSDKDEPSAGDDRPAQIDGAPVIGNLILFARTGKPAHRSQRYIPKNRTCFQINSNQRPK